MLVLLLQRNTTEASTACDVPLWDMFSHIKHRYVKSVGCLMYTGRRVESGKDRRQMLLKQCDQEVGERDRNYKATSLLFRKVLKWVP